MKNLCIVALCGMMISLAPPAGADVVEMTDGKRQEGVITRDIASENSVTIRTSGGDIAIPRAKIARLEKEPEATSRMRLGDQFTAAGKNAEALEEYRRAAELDRNNTTIAEKLKAAEAARDAAMQQKAGDADARVRENMEKALQLAREKQFEQAEKLMKDNAPAQDSAVAAEYSKSLARVYVLWGNDRLDRQDNAGAQQRYESAIRLDPSNDEAKQRLMVTWEADPTKLAELVETYRKSNRPEDRVKLAETLYRLRNYDEALPLYLDLYKTPDFQTKPNADRIRQMFEVQHRAQAQKGDFEGALNTYHQFLAFSPNESPLPLYRYEYMLRAGKIDANDAKQRAELATWAEEHGMTDTARQEYNNVLKMDPKNAVALAGLKRFADADLADMFEFFGTQQYLVVIRKATEMETAYGPYHPTIVEQARSLAARAEVEQKKVQKTREQQAVLLAQRGDDYYNQALAYLSTYMSANVNPNVRVFSPKTEATKYFRLSIQAYQQALQIDPSLGNPTSYDLNRKIADAYAKYATLVNPAPPPDPFRRRSVERNTTD